MTGRYVAPSGSEVYFEEAGAGRPILAVHGVGGGAHFFRGVAERLRAPHRVVAIDLPGTGRSVPRGANPAEIAKGLTLDGWMTDLGAFVREHLQEPAVIIGHSLGTILALEAWRRFPGAILALVFVGGLPVTRPLIRERLSDRIAAIARDGGLSGWGAKVSPGNFSPAAFASRPEVIGLFERVFELQVPEAYIRSIEILLAASAVDVVPTVNVPVASISGMDDQYAPPENVREFLTALPQPAHVTMLPDVGHLPFLEAPEAFCTALREFLLDT
jgi:pimeloyl-ACP methyl ester carboxylesterase